MLMLKGTGMIGKPIMASDSGKEIDMVEDIVFDGKSNQIIALLLPGGWRKDGKILPWSGVHAVGEDAVVVASEDVIVEADSLVESDRLFRFKESVEGVRIMTTVGRELGKISDLFYYEQSGAISGFEVSAGIIADKLKGQSFIPAVEVLRFGDDVAFVAPELVNLMEGERNNLNDARQAIKEEWGQLVDRFERKIRQVSESTSDMLENGKQTLENATADITEDAKLDALNEDWKAASSAGKEVLDEKLARADDELKRMLAERNVEVALGRQAQHTVFADDNVNYVVIANQIVTGKVIEAAREYHKESELLDAVGLNLEDIIRASGRDLKETFSQTAKDGLEFAKGVMHSIKTTVSETKQEIQERMEEKRQANLEQAKKQ